MDKMMVKFKEAGMTTIFAKSEMPYDKDTVLTETNIIGYLQSLEELIS